VPGLRLYRVFISHAWHRGEHYERVVRWLDEAPNFRWENLSVPEADPIHSEADLDYELRNQMRNADVFLILAGMYVAHSEVIAFELRFARRIGKPILAVKPWGNQVMPVIVQAGAAAVVNWNGASIVQAIRQFAVATG
jgi:hypothetical protein